MKTVAYASFGCPKDIGRALENAEAHMESHKYKFDEKFFVFQRCTNYEGWRPVGPWGFYDLSIRDEDYPTILGAFGIKWPDPVLDELTHGWGAPHFWAHHCVNHLKVLQHAKSDYIVFADADCYMKSQPEGKSWVDKGIEILESHPEVFVISPNDGSDERLETIMSQQMFLVNTKKMREMEFIPWDGKFIEGGPFREYYGLLEGAIHRYMAKNNFYRYVLNPEYRYYHLQWH